MSRDDSQNSRECPYGRGPAEHGGLPRRTFLAGAGALAAGALGYPLLRRIWQDPQPVFLARTRRYDGALAQVLRDGLDAVGLPWDWIRGRKVLLKPNLVEPSRQSPHATTHPAMILAAAEVFRRAGATVSVGEGSANLRDTELILAESGVGELLSGEKIPFTDLNYGPTRTAANAGRLSKFTQFRFPRPLAEADLVVSLGKLKTHHWAGFTASMKNLFGTLPGSVYGWPKNALHCAGIPETIVDLAASVPRTLGIIDAVLCMEGDGPIMGTPKPLEVVAVGQNLPALDATLARLIGLDPLKVPYLALADGRLGPVRERQVICRGQAWRELTRPFAILDMPYLQAMRAS
jgi:uncharacterized protein (DUF362 family)